MNSKTAIAVALSVAVGVTIVSVSTRSDEPLTRVHHSLNSNHLGSGKGWSSNPFDVVVNKSTTGLTGAGNAASPLSAAEFLAVGLGVFGNGVDGDVTLTGNTTLTRNMYYRNLTINSGVSVQSDSWRIFVFGTLTMESGSAIRRNGGNGGNGGNPSGGIGSCGLVGSGGAGTSRVLPIGASNGGSSGAGGVVITGQPSTSAPFPQSSSASLAGTACVTVTSPNGGNGLDGDVPGRGGGGGAGGCRGGGTSGLSGTAGNNAGAQVAAPANLGSPRWLISALTGASTSQIGVSNKWGGGSGPINAGAGGGSCSRQPSTNVNAGGGGGGTGGGWVVVTARKMVCNGCVGLEAVGGTGGNGGNGQAGGSTNEPGGGAGGGGPGGIITCIVGQGNCVPTNVSGGQGGTGGLGKGDGGTGGDGGDGGDGYVIFYRMGPS